MVSLTEQIRPEQIRPEQIRHQAREIAEQMSQECVARRLRQVNRTITRLYDEALRPHGLTVNQLNILAVVISENQIQPGQLGRSLGMEKSTVSRTISRMEDRGWLKVAQGKDSRTQILSVTHKGRQLLLTVTPIWDNLQTGVLNPTNGDNLLQMLAIEHEPQPEAAFEIASKTAAYENEQVNEQVSADDFYL